MLKRSASLFLTIALMLGCMVLPADARASEYLSSYRALISGSSGKLEIGYTVVAGETMTSIGVSKIQIYKSNGTLVATITGSTTNGLLVKNSDAHSDTYTYSGKSGESYYAVVTFIAKDSSGSDSKSVTTKTVKIK